MFRSLTCGVVVCLGVCNDDQGRVYQNCKFHEHFGRASVLGHGHISHIWKCIISLRTFFFFLSLHLVTDSYNNQGRVHQNCKFHDPWDRGSCVGACSYSENAIFLLQETSSCLHWGMGQTNYVYSNDKQGKVYQNCKLGSLC